MKIDMYMCTRLRRMLLQDTVSRCRRIQIPGTFFFFFWDTEQNHQLWISYATASYWTVFIFMCDKIYSQLLASPSIKVYPQLLLNSNLHPQCSFFCLVSLAWWVIAPHLMCYFTKWYYRSYMSNLRTFVPEGLLCVLCNKVSSSQSSDS